MTTFRSPQGMVMYITLGYCNQTTMEQWDNNKELPYSVGQTTYLQLLLALFKHFKHTL